MDQAFIHKVKQIVLHYIEDENFGANELASKINLSTSQLLRRIKNITGKTTNEFIRDLRLHEAAKLIKEDKYTASEISFQVGFSSPSYFNKCFHDHFGLTPGEYKDQKEITDNKYSPLTSGNKSSQRALNNIFLKKFYQKNKSKQSIKPYIIYSLLSLILIAIVLFLFKDRIFLEKSFSTNSRVQYFNIVLPENAPISFKKSQAVTGHTAFDISADGTKIVYVTEQEGKLLLAIRSLDTKEIQILTNTEGAYSPFFSPDGHWVAFFTRDKIKGSILKKISIISKVSIELCAVSNPFGGDWNNKGQIIFGDNMGTKLKIVSETGGRAKSIELFIDGKKFLNRIRFPKFLPDGDHVITSGNPITVFSIHNGNGKMLNENGSNVNYLNSGHLIFEKNSKLMVCLFDLKKLGITGTPFPMFQNIRTEIFSNAGQFTISDNGVLIFVDNMPSLLVKFMWIDRNGKVIDTLSLPPANYNMFSLSPSGDLLAFSLSKEILIYNLINKRRIKIPGSNEDRYPFFTQDGNSVVFNRGNRYERRIFMYSIDSNKTIDVLNIEEGWVLHGLSPDGRYLGLFKDGDLLTYSFENDTILPIIQTNSYAGQITFSPDSRFIIYESEESGQLEIFVQPFPTNGKKWNISQGFGFDPMWSFDGKEIYYRNNNQLFAVEVNIDSGFVNKDPELLFQGDFADVLLKSFAISNDNKKILILKPMSNVETTRELTIIDNWFVDLKNKIPAND